MRKSRVRWRSLKKGDIEHFVENAKYLEDDREKDKVIKYFARQVAPYHPRVIESVDGEPIALIAVATIWPGVGEFWTLTTKNIDKYPKDTLKLYKKFIWWYSNTHKLHRMQIHVTWDQEGWISWLNKMGFKIEGVMPKYTIDKQTAVRMAYVR